MFTKPALSTHRLTGSVVPAARRARAVAAATLATLALALTALLAPSAHATTVTPGDFSPLISGNPSGGWVLDDCYVELGFVYDAHPASTGYHHIGGVRINCNSRHSFISATVAMYYSNGSRWVQYGSSAYGVKYNVTGSGSGAAGILDTPAYCVNGFRGSWIVGATVSTNRATRTVYSQVPAPDPASGAC